MDKENYFHFLDDHRGAHSKFFVEGNSFLKEIKEVYMTRNYAGTFRGMHKQEGTNKLLKVVNGEFLVFLIVLSERIPEGFSKLDNNTWVKKVKPEDKPIEVPSGDFVGYLSLEYESTMLYMTDNHYEPEKDETKASEEVYKYLAGHFMNISERDLEAELLRKRERRDSLKS